MNTIKGIFAAAAIVAAAGLSSPAFSQTKQAAPLSAEAKAKSDAEVDSKAAEWVSSLNLKDAAKEARLKQVIATHLKAVRDWHNSHSAADVPPGINLASGNKLSELERQVIADSAIPKSVHQDLMTGLKADLSETQVEEILDKYTIGKVAFTMKAYKEIVPNMTAQEEDTILKNLKQAREQAVDFKNMTEISAIFEIYKTKNEQFLNANGRSWKQMYKEYTAALKAKKAAAAAAEKKN
jgi:hypothetical protein